MDKKRVAVCTLGCKVNQYESAAIAGMFRDRGYLSVDFDDKADIYIINTCTVTHLGDRKSRQLIRRASRNNPEALVAVTGCYAQTAPGEVMDIPGVDLVVGTKDRALLVDLVEGATKSSRPVNPINAVSSYGKEDIFEELPALPLQERVRATLKIQEGCNNFCTYCIVPHARGPLRSRRPGQVMEAVRKIVQAGHKEIVLTGIHTGAYGRDLEDGINLAGLLRDLSVIPGLSRIRLSSIEPNDITPELVDTISNMDNFCRHLHVPLQSGDDTILKRMGRRYSTWDFARLVNVLRENLPDLGLTTDVMVGFPGETEENFDNTFKFVQTLPFTGMHVFKFSPRKGTPAASFDDQVEARLKEGRSRKLIKLSEDMAWSFAKLHLGLVLEVLAEKPLAGQDNLYEGLTDNYIRVVFPGSEEIRGAIVRVRAEKLNGTFLEGAIITN